MDNLERQTVVTEASPEQAEKISSTEQCVTRMENSFLDDLCTRQHSIFADNLWTSIYNKGHKAGEENDTLKDYFRALSDTEKMKVMAIVDTMDEHEIDQHIASDLICKILFRN